MQKTDKRTVLSRMKKVRAVVQAEITGNSQRGGSDNIFARGLASEGFAGGYLQALDDIDGALVHGYPSDHRGYWRTAETKQK